MKSKIHSVFPNYWNKKWVSYTHSSISDAISSSGIEVVNYVYSAENNSGYIGESCFPGRGYRFFNFLSDRFKNDCLFHKLTRNIVAEDIVYSWLGFERGYLKSKLLRNVRWVKEFINCPLYLRERQLEKAYASVGLTYNSNVSISEINQEIESAKIVSLNFCSNPRVYRALLEASVPLERCALVSYGWDAKRLHGDHCYIERDSDTVNFIFVGTFDVRKGAADIMKAWKLVGDKAKLIIAGNIDPIIKIQFSDVLSRDSVVLLGHVEDIGSVYRSGDVFLFPSWEEGGPLVTLEALSQGLYCVTSLMGSAGIIENFPEIGEIVEPGDHDQLAEAIVRLCRSQDLLNRVKPIAKNLSSSYDWRNAGHLRSVAINSLN